MLPLTLINLLGAAVWHYTADWSFLGATPARWLLGAALIGVPYLALGRRLFSGHGIGPRTYRFAT
jgi:hypothetical protein